MAVGPFEQLDYLYTPSRDVAADVRFFVDVLGGRLGFAIDGMGARVAMVELANGPPHLLLADHLEGERPIQVYRVGDLRKATAVLKKRGLRKVQSLEIPMGPCASFVTPADIASPSTNCPGPAFSSSSWVARTFRVVAVKTR